MIMLGNNTCVDNQLKTESVACDLCGANDYQVLFKGKDRLHHVPGIFPVVQCCRCQLVYLNPRPAQDTLDEYYPEDYSPFQRGKGITQRLQSWLRVRLARRIQKTIPLGGRVLEVGCATGDLLVPLRDMGVEVAGIEISQHAAEIARRNYYLEVHTGTLFDSPYAPNSFDAVVLRHVIEHFPSASQALGRVFSLLKPGGSLFITTPNLDSLEGKIFGHYWHDLDPPRHLVVFSVATLYRMLENIGFEIRNTSHHIAPNAWIYSVRNVLTECFGDGLVQQALSIYNPFMLLLFSPIGILQKILKKSGRIDLLARKRL